jgi:hypothetical protein
VTLKQEVSTKQLRSWPLGRSTLGVSVLNVCNTSESSYLYLGAVLQVKGLIGLCNTLRDEGASFSGLVTVTLTVY